MTSIQPNSHSPTTALILSGGGSRFGYFMGMYGALCEIGKQPDIILASCGGAYISGLISLCADPARACQMMYSRPFYEMFCRFQPIVPDQKNHHTKTQLLRSAYQRWFNYQKAKRIHTNNKTSHQRQPLSISLLDSLQNQALYQIDKESKDNPFWQTDKLLQVSTNTLPKFSKKPSTLIVSARTQPYRENNLNGGNVDKYNNHTGFLWQQVLRSDTHKLTTRLRQLHNEGNLTASISQYSPHVLPEMHIASVDDMPIEIAVRASINDMFYFAPIQHQGNTLLGGAIDLLPIELACQLADEVYAERKLPFDKWTAEPAIHSVFRFFANDRRADWHSYQPTIQAGFQHPSQSTNQSNQSQNSKIHWIDTTDNRKKLLPVLIRKPKPLRGYIDLEYPSYQEFVQILTAQYEFGYQAVEKSLSIKKK